MTEFYKIRILYGSCLREAFSAGKNRNPFRGHSAMRRRCFSRAFSNCKIFLFSLNIRITVSRPSPPGNTPAPSVRPREEKIRRQTPDLFFPSFSLYETVPPFFDPSPSGRGGGNFPFRMKKRAGACAGSPLSEFSFYFAYSTLRNSRITLTLICPGYSSSDSIFFAISFARNIACASSTCSGFTITRTSRPAWIA